MLGNIKQPLEKEVQDLEKSLEILNIFLQDTKFVAGNCLTIADFSIVATISTAEVQYINYKFKNFNKIPILMKKKFISFLFQF